MQAKAHPPKPKMAAKTPERIRNELMTTPRLLIISIGYIIILETPIGSIRRLKKVLTPKPISALRPILNTYYGN
jgi:hypothetical protein